MNRLANAMDLTGSGVTFSEDKSNHRRGKYPTVATGLSYGGGATVNFGWDSQLMWS